MICSIPERVNYTVVFLRTYRPLVTHVLPTIIICRFTSEFQFANAQHFHSFNIPSRDNHVKYAPKIRCISKSGVQHVNSFIP